MINHSTLLKHPSKITGCCASCRQTVTFTLIGVQTWPQRVAAQTDVPAQVGLYGCPVCTTSVSETTLVDAQSA
jgi:hypothetical protein